MTPADIEGITIGPALHSVDAERVRAFVDVTGDDPNRWLDHAPPGYAAALLFAVAADLLTDARIAPYLATLIHVDQQFTYPAPIGVGTEVEMIGTVQRVRERAGAYFVTFLAEGRVDGTVVLESRSTFLMSDQAATGGPDAEPEPPVHRRGETEIAGDRCPPEIGRTFAMAKSASRYDLVRYAASTSDFNPLHWDHESATAAGLPRVVVHGLLMLSWMGQQAAAFGSGPVPVATIKARFRSALLPAEAARVEGVIGAVAGDAGDADLRLRLVSGDRDVVTGTAIVRLEGVTR